VSGSFTFNPFAQEPGSVQVGPGLRDGTIPAGANLRFLEPADGDDAEPMQPQDGDPAVGDDGEPMQPQTKVLTKPDPRKATTGRTPRTK